jgi:hypothetical protein
LEKFQASRAAYHGGDFNGVSCRRIVGNAKEISDAVRDILLWKKMKNALTEQYTIKWMSFTKL